MSKKEKGMRAAQWLMDTSGKEVPPCLQGSGGQAKNHQNGQLDVREAGPLTSLGGMSWCCTATLAELCGAKTQPHQVSTSTKTSKISMARWKSQGDPNGNRDRKWNLEMRSRTGSTPCTTKMPCPLVWRT